MHTRRCFRLLLRSISTALVLLVIVPVEAADGRVQVRSIIGTAEYAENLGEWERHARRICSSS